MRGGVRPLTTLRDPDTGRRDREVYADVTARLPLTRRLEAMVGVGRTPGDPVRSTIGSTYISLGIRINLVPAPPPTLPILARALERRARSIRESPEGSRALVDVADDGTLQVLIDGATSVEIMADFTDWVPTPLQRLPSGAWARPGRLAAGAYRLNVRVDGGRWSVPLGTRLEEDEFGGAAGVIVIR